MNKGIYDAHVTTTLPLKWTSHETVNELHENPNHTPTYLCDFIDEIDGRQRAICNACRRQLQEPNDSIVPIHRLRDNGYLFECIC